MSGQRKGIGAGLDGRLWLGGWLLVGMAARLIYWQRFALREDEALYAYWARLISSGQDPMLERVAVDKPPFFIYSLAHVFDWFGPSLAAGRALNELCSFVTLLLLWLLARRLYGKRTAAWALAIFALSPFAISFAPTLYTDPMLVAWLVLALLLAAYGRGLSAGLALGMGFASKQTALLFIPLVMGLLLLAPIPTWPHRLTRTRLRAALWRLLMAAVGFAYVWYKVWQWDGWRILPAEIPSFWEQAWHSYGGLALLPPGQWPARLAAWAGVWQWLGGWWPGTLVLLALLGYLALALRQRPRGWQVDLLVLAYVAAFLLLHVLVSFQPWDRYLLGIAPLLALLAGRAWTLLGKQAAGRGRLRQFAAIGALLLLLGGGGRAAMRRIPVGGDHGAYDGITTVASYLHEHVPDEGGVLYQRWLGWHWNWYLWDGPKGRVYWADPAMLVNDIRPHPRGYIRYIVFPAWHADERRAVEQALATINQRLTPRLFVSVPGETSPRFSVYQIIPRN